MIYTQEQIDQMEPYHRWQLLRYGNILLEWVGMFGPREELENGDDGRGCIVEGHVNLPICNS